jgi:hypothetical protein
MIHIDASPYLLLTSGLLAFDYGIGGGGNESKPRNNRSV